MPENVSALYRNSNLIILNTSVGFRQTRYISATTSLDVVFCYNHSVGVTNRKLES